MFVTLGWMLLTSLPLHHPVPTHFSTVASARHRARPAGQVALWTDRDQPYQRGDGARVYLRTDEPAYVTVLRVDTDGRVRVLFPREPWGDSHVPGGRAFEVAGGRDGGSFVVDDYPGVGYLFSIASAHPFDYDHITRGDYWDYRLMDGGRIQGDPYVALTDLAARIAPEGKYSYDVVPYHVGARHDFPRFVCYDCHAYASYDEWDPYRAACSRFRVVVYDDPRYYPYRYNRGRNVVAARPAHPGPRYVFRDADPGRDFVTRVPRDQGEGSRRRMDEPGRTSDDVGGRGAVPTPGLHPPRPRDSASGQRVLTPAGPLVPRRPQGAAQLSPDRRPARPPRSTGEPELRRRKP
ncbi:MAG: DUF4384 domain-containing protein [Gemmatimonadales bacterium]|nr:DUF4384 domain-containing protein [Gemmatimonadales bacterium]